MDPARLTLVLPSVAEEAGRVRAAYHWADRHAAAPDVVLVFVPDLIDEVRAAQPEIEAGGGRWMPVRGAVIVMRRAALVWTSRRRLAQEVRSVVPDGRAEVSAGSPG